MMKISKTGCGSFGNSAKLHFLLGILFRVSVWACSCLVQAVCLSVRCAGGKAVPGVSVPGHAATFPTAAAADAGDDSG